MNRQTSERPAARVLVVVESSAEAELAIQTAAALAADLRAELLGLFVENADLMRLADLPFATEIAIGLPALRRLDRDQLERMLRAQAESARRTLAEVANRLSVQWSFQVMRGQSVPIALANADEVDLLMIKAAGRVLRYSVKVTQAARGPIVVVVDESPRSERTLDTATRLAAADGQGLLVLCTATADQSGALQEYITKLRRNVLTKGMPAEGRIHRSEDILRIARQRRAKIVVISRGSRLLTKEGLARLTEKLDCPLLLVG
jgi:K+-sensing histidine kinase KdpD